MIGWLRGAGSDPVASVAGRQLPVAIRRNPRARRLILRLAPDGSEIRVTLPPWGRTAEAMAFVRLREDWLAGQLAAMPARQAPAADGTLLYRGESLRIAWQPAAPRRPQLAGETLRVGGPEQGLEGRLRRWLEGEARALLEEDLAHYCARIGQTPPPLRLSSAQRRWGSCSSRGIIRINWRLVQAPEPVRRSVVAHEVAHLVHFDHSPAFHGLLASLFGPDLAEANRWLKQHGRSLYAAFG